MLDKSSWRGKGEHIGDHRCRACLFACLAAWLSLSLTKPRSHRCLLARLLLALMAGGTALLGMVGAIVSLSTRVLVCCQYTGAVLPLCQTSFLEAKSFSLTAS